MSDQVRGRLAYLKKHNLMDKHGVSASGSNELLCDLMIDSFSDLAQVMNREIEDYDSDAAQEECFNNLLRDATQALKKFNIIFDENLDEFIQVIT